MSASELKVNGKELHPIPADPPQPEVEKTNLYRKKPVVVEVMRVPEGALRTISAYNSNGEGICPYGCDCPAIAIDALAAAEQEGGTP